MWALQHGSLAPMAPPGSQSCDEEVDVVAEVVVDGAHGSCAVAYGAPARVKPYQRAVNDADSSPTDEGA